MPAGSVTGGVSSGRIPFRVLVGAVGHRRFDDEVLVARRVRAALRQVRTLFGAPHTTDIVFTIVSPLAEGADRLVAREGLAELSDAGVELMAVLPLPEDDYRTDFESEGSRAEFDELLARASAVVPPPPDPSDREGAYWRAGREVVNRSDVLVAVWDGEQARGHGGTAEVVEYARARGTPRLVVPVGPDGGVDEGARLEPTPHVDRTRSALQRFDDYNGRPAEGKVAALIEAERKELRAHSRGTAIDEAVERVAGWVLPHQVRADLLALRYQRLYHFMGDAVFALSALAVAAVALQTSFTPHRPVVALAEVAFLLLLLGLVRYARRGHMHDNWIGCRSLAESFRSALFIVLADAGDRETMPGSSTEGGELWFRRAFSEAWRWRPTPELDDAAAPALRAFLTAAWIEHQIDYHRKYVAERTGRRHRAVVAVIAALFVAALVVALLHAVNLGHEEDWLNELLIFLAIALPGFGAAATGHREQRQYRLHRRRSIRMAARLERIKADFADAGDLRSIQRLAREAQSVMVEENLDWYGVVELQDIEMVM